MGNRQVIRAALALSLSSLLLLAGVAEATEVTRASYTEAVEPICKVSTQANEKILKGVKAEVKANKLKPAAAQFAKAAKALKQTLTQLEAVPQPSADAARLGKWLGYVKGEAELFEATAKKLKAGDKTGAQRMAVELTHEANLANDEVLSFDFHYCRVEPSKFS
jgi:hypothetical protein